MRIASLLVCGAFSALTCSLPLMCFVTILHKVWSVSIEVWGSHSQKMARDASMCDHPSSQPKARPQLRPAFRHAPRQPEGWSCLKAEADGTLVNDQFPINELGYLYKVLTTSLIPFSGSTLLYILYCTVLYYWRVFLCLCSRCWNRLGLSYSYFSVLRLHF